MIAKIPAKELIYFTLELEENVKLEFLDILIDNAEDIFETNVHRKVKHINRYLTYHYNHSIWVKIGVIKSLYERAKETTV